jgi:tripartite-type tricarboxylate transporter receptor subunit TctC
MIETNDELRGVGMRIAAIAAVSLALAGFAQGFAPAFAQGLAQAPVSESFKGKTVTLIVGATPGGGFDTYGRLLARHIGRHLPGQPAVVVSNMSAGLGLTAANHLYNAAPRDGTAIGILVQTLAQEQVQGIEAIQFDAAQYGWVGRMAPNIEVAYAWHAVPVTRFEDLRQRETIFAGMGTVAFIYPALLNKLLDTRIKLVRGYRSTASVHLALERGEVEGTTGSLDVLSNSAPDWLRDRKLTLLLQYQHQRHPSLSGVPTVMEFVRSAEDRDVFSFYMSSAMVGRSIVAPPGLPPERLALLRRAFDDTMKDPQFLADAAQLRFELGPLPGAAVQSIIERQVNVSSAIRDRILALGWRQ